MQSAPRLVGAMCQDRAQFPALLPAAQKCQLACEADNEYNRIYVIFSPNKYSKPIDQSASNSMIRTLTYNDFHAWLSKQKRLDTKLHCKPFDIVIKK